MLTNKGLVEYAKRALKEKWGYVWGTYGQVLTKDVFAMKLQQYPDAVGKYKQFILDNYLGKRTADCAGLIKGYLWLENNEPVYKPVTDVSANGFFRISTENGIIGNSIPNIPGLLLCMDGHIGVYIGDGQVIEAKGTKYGVIQSPLSGPGANAWTHWVKCPFIKYETNKTYQDLIKEVSLGQSEQWIQAINNLVELSCKPDVDPNLKIFKYLPLLIEKVGNR